uniref:KIB1-4 beta-propeller domain-containing protein n=1 Tax=Hordeum vulgare subsp. vulgare TaxID=112509 RepID=A0A287R443_HORVV
MVSGVGLVADSSLAVSFFNPLVLAVAKPGADSWTVAHNDRMNTTLPFVVRFYCTNYRGVMVLNMGSDQQPPWLHLVADRSKSFNFNQMSQSLHLADNGGELMLVHRIRSQYIRRYDVYRVDLKAGVLVPVKGFNGRAMFMGMGRTISVSAHNPFPCVAPDTIYMAPECDGKIQGYNIVDGRVCDLIGAACPRSIVDCIWQGTYLSLNLSLRTNDGCLL